MRKKINLDGPDGFKQYQHDEDITQETLSTRQSGGGSIVVLISFSYKRTMELQVVQGRQNAAGYIGMLERSLLFTEEARLCEDWLFVRIVIIFRICTFR